MMKHHQRSIGKNDEWLTPPEIIKALGEFDLDPCAPSVRPWPTAREHISIPRDGLTETWRGRVWCNPPFNRYTRPLWMEKMAAHGRGILLIPAATETSAFDAFVWRWADAVCFLRGRPHFHFVDGRRAKCNSGTAIVLAAYGSSDVAALHASKLGKVIEL